MKNIARKVVLLSLFISTQSIASDWAEADKLQRLVKHLEASKALIDAAQANANPNKRLQFDYEALSKNVTDMQKGIKQYLNKPLEPRSYEELKNTFSNYENK